MGKFAARFVRISSGRENRVTVHAANHLEALEKLRDDPDVGEVMALEEIFEPATERQLDYLRDLLGRTPPSGMSKGAASDMISELVDRRREAEWPDEEYEADEYLVTHDPKERPRVAQDVNGPRWLLPLVLLAILGLLAKCTG